MHDRKCRCPWRANRPLNPLQPFLPECTLRASRHQMLDTPPYGFAGTVVAIGLTAHCHSPSGPSGSAGCCRSVPGVRGRDRQVRSKRPSAALFPGITTPHLRRREQWLSPATQARGQTGATVWMSARASANAQGLAPFGAAPYPTGAGRSVWWSQFLCQAVTRLPPSLSWSTPSGQL